MWWLPLSITLIPSRPEDQHLVKEQPVAAKVKSTTAHHVAVTPWPQAKYRGKDPNCQQRGDYKKPFCRSQNWMMVAFQPWMLEHELHQALLQLGPVRRTLWVLPVYEQATDAWLDHTRIVGGTSVNGKRHVVAQKLMRFTYSKLLMERYHPELKTRKCDLTWPSYHKIKPESRRFFHHACTSSSSKVAVRTREDSKVLAF